MFYLLCWAGFEKPQSYRVQANRLLKMDNMRAPQKGSQIILVAPWRPAAV